MGLGWVFVCGLRRAVVGVEGSFRALVWGGFGGCGRLWLAQDALVLVWAKAG